MPQKHPKQKFPHLVGSKWTAVEVTFGWRHFVVKNRQDRNGLVFAELQAACDESVRFWLNARALKDRDLWLPGWRSRLEQGQAPSADAG